MCTYRCVLLFFTNSINFNSNVIQTLSYTSENWVRTYDLGRLHFLQLLYFTCSVIVRMMLLVTWPENNKKKLVNVVQSSTYSLDTSRPVLKDK